MKTSKKAYRVLTLNPGSTSTKIGLYEGGRCLFEKNIRHDVEALKQHADLKAETAWRKDAVIAAVDQEGVRLDHVDAISARGGLLHPLESGTYVINDAMLKDLQAGAYGSHASNGGALIASELAELLHIPAYIVDPVVVDEMDSVAKVTGLKGVERTSIFHALNQKAAARKAAAARGLAYEESRLIVAHLGGGITVGAHNCGRVVDVNDGLHGDGPFSPERAGGLPVDETAALLLEEELNRNELRRKVSKEGGLMSHFGTHDAQVVEARALHGDEEALLVWDAMAYNVAKAVGAKASVLKGRVDAIVLTGGLAYSEDFTTKVKNRTDWIAPVDIRAGEDELEALYEGALRVLEGEENAKTYAAAVR
ncbi:butyrate kinase [Salsuginibacillus halophilus]|uniref:Probable butyrate kinase n=1 Tax=Salsuginibacillus halophilus TaxID=517424 RepID=A0A2P8HY74_9BACI|nr:butyrate kinase [Salsuginibacillus halophilus]